MSKLTRKAWLRVSKVLETFFAEAAVLLAVFPILDELVARGVQGVTLRLVVTSVLLTLVLLSIAMLLAVLDEEE